MHPRWIRLARVLVIFAFMGWVAGTAVIHTNADQTLFSAAIHKQAFRACMAGAVGGLAWAPLMAWLGLRWPWGALIAIPAGLTGAYAFFFIWPHEWQASRIGAWKSVAIIGGVYWRYLLPISVLAGVFGVLWAGRPVREPKWMRAMTDGGAPPEGAPSSQPGEPPR